MNIKQIIAALCLMAAPLCANAQSVKENEAISKDLKNKIDIINADIKALKARKKADPTNTTYDPQISTKMQELKEAKDRKSVIDKAISAEKKSIKETKQAKEAAKKHEQASRDAERLKAQSYNRGKSNEMLSDEYESQIDILNADIKALKARKKSNPSDTKIDAEIKNKEIKLKEVKRNKKVIDTAIKANKTADREASQAEKAQKRHEEAAEKAADIKQDLNAAPVKEQKEEE